MIFSFICQHKQPDFVTMYFARDPTVICYFSQDQGSKIMVVRWPESTKNAVGLPNHSCAVVQWPTGNV